jgi:hypothetical protein
MSTATVTRSQASGGRIYGIERASTAKTGGWIMVGIAVVVLYIFVGSALSWRPDVYEACLQEADIRSCDEPKPEIAWIGLLSGLLDLTMGVLIIHHGQTTHLKLSPAGLEFYSGYSFVRLVTPWENVARIESKKLFPIGDWLMLREPAAVHASPLAKLLVTRWEKRRIPLTMFYRNWKNTSIGDEIKRYAPQLLSEARA